MIIFTYASLVLALGSLSTVAIMPRAWWRRHKWKVFAVSSLAVILAIIGLAGVSA